MDSCVNERDFDLLSQDRYTFEVLARILRGPCELIRTDHQGLILCHSEQPYPVWIWTRDGCPEADKEQAWRLAETLRPLSGGYRFNMKYELAARFLERAKEAGLNAGYFMRLYAYDCPAPIEPDAPAEGALHPCTEEDTEEAAALLPLFYTEIGEEPPSRARCREKAEGYIDEGAFFFWRDGAGKTVACCSYKSNRGVACLGSVYTLPAYRRRHYAQSLVYQVTARVKDMGLTPMLYTDANYPASNACYEKIGYVLRGRLCTVAALKQNGLTGRNAAPPAPSPASKR